MAAAAGKCFVKPHKDDLFLYDTPEFFPGHALTKNPVSQPLSYTYQGENQTEVLQIC